MKPVAPASESKMRSKSKSGLLLRTGEIGIRVPGCCKLRKQGGEMTADDEGDYKARNVEGFKTLGGFFGVRREVKPLPKAGEPRLPGEKVKTEPKRRGCGRENPLPRRPPVKVAGRSGQPTFRLLKGVWNPCGRGWWSLAGT